MPACGALMLAMLAAFGLFGAATARAQGTPPPIISKIEIIGNQRVEEDAIRIHITQAVGQPLDANEVTADEKSIYLLGFFDSVSAHVEQQGSQNVLVYRVKERPQITDVKLYGMKAIRSNDDKIVAAMKVQPGTILNPVAVKETINNIEEVYADKGYTDAKVTFKPIPQPDNTAFGEFDVSEGTKVEITKIQFIGNHAFSSTVLEANMETRTYSRLLSWLTNWGSLDPKKLQADVDRLEAFYYDNGYLNVQIAPPQIVRTAQQYNGHHYYRRRHALPRRPYRHHGQFEISAPRAAPAADVEVRATVPRLQSPAAGAGAVGFLLEPRLRLRQRRSAHAVGADRQARQCHIRDQSGP